MYLNNMLYSRGLGLFFIKTFQPILLIISFGFINELMKSNTLKIDYENMKKRSIIYTIKELIVKFIDLLKGSFLVKSTKIRVIIAIMMTILFYASISFWNRGMVSVTL